MAAASDQPSERVAKLMAQPHGDLSDAAEQLAALMSAASAELLDMICAIDGKESFRDDGATSTTSWVVAMLRVTHATAKEWVRVARALDRLPHLRDAYSAGMLSWDQVRHATVFVTPEKDEEAARDLPSYTAAQLEERAKFHRRRTPADGRESARRRFFTWRKDLDTGGYRYRGFLPAEAGAIVNAALAERARLIGKDPVTGLWDPAEQRQADALVDLARSDVLTHPGPDPTVVVVHVDSDVVDARLRATGPSTASPSPPRASAGCCVTARSSSTSTAPTAPASASAEPAAPHPGGYDAAPPTATARAGSPAADGGSVTSTTSSTGPTTAPPTPGTSAGSVGSTTTSSTKAAG